MNNSVCHMSLTRRRGRGRETCKICSCRAPCWPVPQNSLSLMSWQSPSNPLSGPRRESSPTAQQPAASVTQLVVPVQTHLGKRQESCLAIHWRTHYCSRWCRSRSRDCCEAWQLRSTSASSSWHSWSTCGATSRRSENNCLPAL